MEITKTELTAVLSQYNPWWRGESSEDLSSWKRAAFYDFFEWVYDPPAPRAVMLSGARQVGKTTLLLQAIQKLLHKENVPAANILYVTFDHPLIKLSGVDAVLQAWRERIPSEGGTEYLFLDEAQFIKDWNIWIKHQVDFNKNKRIVFTGSAMPLIKGQDSAPGRWHNIKLTTLSFYEYLELFKYNIEREISLLFNDIQKLSDNAKSTLSIPLTRFNKLNKQFSLPVLKELNSLEDLFSWQKHDFQSTIENFQPYVGSFHQYLVRGGFPQAAMGRNVTQAQRLIREDIVDKILKRDMTALFGVRSVLDLEKTFLYLCMHNGGLLDMSDLGKNLEVKRPTAEHFIELLEGAHLIYRLRPFGYGKEILRSKNKIYLADAAIAPAVLLQGASVLDNFKLLGQVIEACVSKHLLAHFGKDFRVTFWSGKHEIDLILENYDRIIPFEVKYRNADSMKARNLKGLIEFCSEKSVKNAYVVTKSLNDFGPMEIPNLSDTKIMKIPASLLCYWVGKLEL
ncbi:MAG: ATP-binding protein [Proteobacteria bacterium]|nr:ATP-binding protein [Pseudomonadota bacterium]